MARILLADDDGMVRDLFERVLAAGGHEVRIAQDGQEALAIAEAGAAFDILVTDVNMPGLDGISLAKKVLAARPSVRVLLMSGFTEELQRGSAEIAGRVATLTKPCSIEDIRAGLKALLA